MYTSIEDVIGKKINLRTEYEKLYQMFTNDQIYHYANKKYSLSGICNIFIEEFPYRGTNRNVLEILEELKLSNRTTIKKGLRDILSLMDLILNVEVFIKNKDDKLKNGQYNFLHTSLIKKQHNLLIKNIEIILNEINYTYISGKESLIKIIPKDSILIDTIKTSENKKLSELLLDYSDFRIERDIDSKGDILNKIAKEIEPLRYEIKGINKKLEAAIFFSLNNLHLRHNNAENKYAKNMSNDQLLYWYDKTFSLILTALRLLNMSKLIEEFESLKKSQNEEEVKK